MTARIGGQIQDDIRGGQRQPSAGYLLYLGFLILLSVAGLIAWLIQLNRGLVVTDMRDIISWGLYIVGFMFFAGIGAGALILSSVPYAFNLRKYKPISKIAAYLSLVSIILAALFILSDLTRLSRVWHLLVYPHWTSPLIWDVLIISLGIFITGFYLWWLIRADQGQIAEYSLQRIARITLITAILIPTVSAWVFGLQISRPFWNSALLLPTFISSALVSGTATLLLILVILKRVQWFNLEQEIVQGMGGSLAVLIVVDMFLLFCELLTTGYMQTPEGLASLNLILTQTGAPAFWFEILGGGIGAFLLLTLRPTRSFPATVALASILVILGIFFKRFNLLMAGFAQPLISSAAVITGPASPNASIFLQVFEASFPYFPSLIEWALTLGITAFGVLLLTIGMQKLT